MPILILVWRGRYLYFGSCTLESGTYVGWFEHHLHIIWVRKKGQSRSSF